VFGDIRINVVVSAVVCIGALVYIAVVRKPREVLEGPAAADAPAEDEPEDKSEPAVVLTKSDKSSDDSTEPDEG